MTHHNVEPALARTVLDSTKIIYMPTPTSIIDFFLQGRGERGVFDLEELVDILKGEKVAKNSPWTYSYNLTSAPAAGHSGYPGA